MTASHVVSNTLPCLANRRGPGYDKGMTEIVEIYRLGWPPILAVSALMLLGYFINLWFGSAERSFRETALNIVIFVTGYGLQVFFINQVQNRVLADLGGLTPWRLPVNAMTFVAA